MSLFDNPVQPPPDGPRLRLLVAYDGTEFRGFARQERVRTVGGTLLEALERVLRQPVEITCAGRTDAGVHAWGQVVTVSSRGCGGAPRQGLPPEMDTARVQRALNGMLGPEVVIREARLVDATFDARYSARWRSYRYTIVNRPAPDPFLARYSWWVPDHLELAALRAGADAFVGEHDFASFCRAGPPGSATVRRVLGAGWEEPGDGILRLEITASAFCWQMMRSVVGTLVDVGTGRRRAGDLMAMLRARDRAVTGRMAPPHGLCLWEVGYGPEDPTTLQV